MSRWAGILRGLAGCLAVASSFAGLVPAAQGSVPCSRYAAPSGSDSAPGTAAAPYRTAQRLAESVRAGETGCLRAGTYDGGMTFRRAGRSGAPVKVRSHPGEKATVAGLVYVARSAPFVVVEGLYLNGRGIDHPSPTINASDVTFQANDVTNDHTGICFMLGDATGEWGRADRAVVRRNRVHNCGELPATNLHHGIYVEATSGARIEGNWFYDNADYGVHLYPDADNTIVRGNVIDQNGKGLTISADGGKSSDGNRIEGNAITSSKLRFNVEAWWPSGNPVPTRNLVARNCLKAGRADWDHNGGIDMEVARAYTLRENAEVRDAGYANPRARDLRMPPGSPCRRTFAGDPMAVPGPDSKFGAVSARKRRAQVRLTASRRKLRRGQPVRLKGRVRRATIRQGQRALIYARARGRRLLVGRARVSRSGRFSLRMRVRARARVLRLRAVVGGIGRSRALRLRVTR